MPAVTRIGDADVAHCSGMVRAAGSGNVFANGIPVSRQGDVNTIHLLPGDPCPPHSAPITSGSSTVKVNTKGCGRVGDALTGCTSVAAGSPNVFVNDAEAVLLLEQVADSVDAVKTAYDVPTLTISSTHATGILKGRTFDGNLGIDVDTNEGLEYGDGGLGGKSPVTQQTGSIDTPPANVKFDGNLFPEAKDSIYLNFLSHTDSRIDPRLKTILEEVSKEWGSSLTITSAFRAPEYNATVGGAKKSTHTEGIATDIRFSNSSVEDRARFLQILKDKGIKGVGCYFPSKDGGEFFHVDIGAERHWGPNGSRTSQYGWALDVLA